MNFVLEWKIYLAFNTSAFINLFMEMEVVIRNPQN